jgi:hypothetical protein
MAIKALNLHDVKTVTHPDDKNDPTKWEIAVIDSRVLGMIQDKATKLTVDADDPDADTGVEVSQNEVNFLIVQFGLKGWSHFIGENGDIVYETEDKVLGSKKYSIAKSDILSSIPQDVLQWLASEIMKLNTLSVKEGKK